MRAVPLWVGSTPDAKIPERVKVRIWEREQGRCWISGRKIMPGDPFDFDHKIALCNGGTHSEDNLAPALRDKHREKTAQDVAEKARVARKRAADLGLKSSCRSKIKSAGFAKAPRQNRASTPLNKPLPPRRTI